MKEKIVDFLWDNLVIIFFSLLLIIAIVCGFKIEKEQEKQDKIYDYIITFGGNEYLADRYVKGGILDPEITIYLKDGRTVYSDTNEYIIEKIKEKD